MMTARTIIASIIVFAFTPQTLLAETVYKGTDAKGNPVFSDKPFPNSEEIKIAPVQTYSAPPVPTTSNTENTQASAPVSYNVSIIEPKTEQLYTHDIQSIPVSISIAPQLQPTDSIVLMLNNQSYGTFDNPAGITLDNLPRGQYQMQINVVSKSDNKIISQSPAVTFFQQRISRITNGAK